MRQRKGFTLIELLVVVRGDYAVFEVVGVEGGEVEEFRFLNLLIAADTDAACALLALNLQTNVPELPGAMRTPQAVCRSRFGIVGAKAALVVAAPDALRERLKQVVSEAEALPHSPLGGAFALDAELNRGSYLIDTEGEIGEETVEAWIELAKNLGMRQIDFHTGKSMRFGDLRPNSKNYPSGKAGVKAVVDKIHAAGLAAGLHTYAFFVAKDSEWVSPTPDPRLAVAARFTLAEDLDAVASVVPVLESTAGISTVTGFQIRNSVTLRIDDELVVFRKPAVTAPFGFLECERGAWGTAPAAHARGARVEQLKECFGLFLPEGDSTLFTEVAARTAAVYNDCGFDMIYLDALDGSDLVAGGEQGWHYQAKFVFELHERLKKPALFEMSTMSHHLWHLRSRMGAWDVPPRGAKRLIDLHARANAESAKLFMPTNLGWWGIFDWAPILPERTMPDDLEYLCGKALGFDSSLSLLVGFTPKAWAESENVRRLGGIIKTYEELRLARAVPEAVLERLREPGAEFLLADKAGRPVFAPVQHQSHSIDVPEESQWGFHNAYEAQPLRLRIEVRMGVAEGEEGSPLLDFQDVSGLTPLPVKDGVRLETDSVAGREAQATALGLRAVNAGAEPSASWGGVSKQFEPPAELSQHAMEVWVKGDGRGALFNVQYETPESLGGGIADHYVDLNYEGWRRHLLVEPESARLGHYAWPYSARHLPGDPSPPFMDVLKSYIIWPSLSNISRLNLWVNGIPQGVTTEAVVGPIRLLPLKAVEIQRLEVRVNDQKVVLPFGLKSGQYAEIMGQRAKLYGARGELLEEAGLAETLPEVLAGENQMEVRTELLSGSPALRARVTVSTQGKEIP